MFDPSSLHFAAIFAPTCYNRRRRPSLIHSAFKPLGETQSDSDPPSTVPKDSTATARRSATAESKAGTSIPLRNLVQEEPKPTPPKVLSRRLSRLSSSSPHHYNQHNPKHPNPRGQPHVLPNPRRQIHPTVQPPVKRLRRSILLELAIRNRTAAALTESLRPLALLGLRTRQRFLIKPTSTSLAGFTLQGLHVVTVQNSPRRSPI